MKQEQSDNQTVLNKPPGQPNGTEREDKGICKIITQ